MRESYGRSLGPIEFAGQVSSAFIERDATEKLGASAAERVGIRGDEGRFSHWFRSPRLLPSTAEPDGAPRESESAARVRSPTSSSARDESPERAKGLDFEALHY